MNVERAAAEHEAWLATVEALREATGGETWDSDRWRPLHAAVTLWGEHLVALRVVQEPEIRERALYEAQDRVAKGVV